VEISRTHFGFEDCPKNYGEREVGYMQSGRFLDKEWNGTLSQKHRSDK
jgi:hypothetical protein